MLTIVKLREIPEIRGPYGRPWSHEDVLRGVGPGWRDLLMTLILRTWLAGWDGELHQVKEKFGTLRWYIGGANEDVHALIEAAERLSGRICEECGRKGKTVYDLGWDVTVCRYHYWRRRLYYLRPRLWYRIQAWRRSRHFRKKR